MAVVWSSNAYPAANDFQYWTGQQEQTSSHITMIAPPVEVGGGPQDRGFVGRFRINFGDPFTAGGTSGQRSEVLTSIAMLSPHACQGNSVWIAWETYFGNPSVVADTNAYRPAANTLWNYFLQFHQGGPAGTPAFAIGVDTTGGSSSSAWEFAFVTRGGTTTNPTSQITHPLTAFAYGWHEFRAFITWGQANGRAKVWVDGVVREDYVGPVGYTVDGSGGSCNYLKQGMYRNSSGGTAPGSTIFAAGTRMGTTEADVLAGGGTEPPPDPSSTPDANTRERRFGKATVGAGRSGFSADNKRGSKFATGLSSSEEADVRDMHIWIEGADGSSSTQKVTLGIYADDGGGGAPGTKFGEVNQEISLAGNASADWVKITSTDPIRVTGTNAWLVAGSGAPSNRLRYATDPIAGALAFNADVYEASAPRLASPFGAAGSDAKEVSICADYDVVDGSTPPPGDTIAPALVEAKTSVAGDSLVFAYSEPLLTSSVPLTTDYAVRVNGVTRSVSSVTIIGSSVHLLLASPVDSIDSVVADYNRASGREVKDLAGNLAPSFANVALVNETLDDEVPVRIINQVRVTSIARRIEPGSHVAGGGGGI